MNSMRYPRPLLAAAVFCPVALLAASCGDKRLAVFPVNGQVSYKDAPTPGALVVFHPVGSQARQSHRPSGYVQQDGSFTLSTYEPGDGAPEGEYDVSISWDDPNYKFDPNAKAAEPKSKAAVSKFKTADPKSKAADA
jgi:hypothetical protein